MTNNKKIERLNNLIDESKDLIEFLKLEPKLKVNINSQIIKERISASEENILKLANLEEGDL